MDKITEKQNPKTSKIDNKSIRSILNIINNEDATVAIAVGKSLPYIENFVDVLIRCFKSEGKLFYVGSGTSGRLGVLDAVECPPTFCTHPEMVQGIIAGGYKALTHSIEGAEDSVSDGEKSILEYGITARDVVLGISASSSTPFVLGALKKAKRIGAKTGLIICNESNRLNYIDYTIPIVVGPEVITGSTRMKSGTATKMVLNMITTVSMIKLNKTYGNLMVDLKASNQKLWDRGTRIIAQLTDLDYEDSFKLLKRTDGEVKTAIVASKLNLSINHARTLLLEVNSSLRKALES